MRETTKVHTGGSKHTYVGGKITETIGGDYHIWGESITYNAGGQITMSGKEGGVVFGDYVPPEEYYVTHPKVTKVEFFDENNKLLNQNTKDFYFGQKLKIKVTTINAKDGEMIYVNLQGKTKSKNQKFDMMNSSGFRWGFVPLTNNQYTTPLFQLNPNWYSDDFENYNYDTHETEIKEEDLNEFYAKVSCDAKTVYYPLAGERLKPIAYKRNYEELIGLFNTDDSGAKDLLTNYENLYIDKYADENDDIKDMVDGFSEWLCEDNPSATIEEIKTKVAKSACDIWDYALLQHKDHSMTVTTTVKKTGEKTQEIKERKAVLDDRPLYWARIVMQVILKRQYVFIEDIKKLSQKDQDDFFKKSIVPKNSKLADVIQLFEEKSRNYTGIDFSKAGSKKKVLITGFDPFLLNSFDHPEKDSYNIRQSNPSGVMALSLCNNDQLGAYIQTMVVPVRYTDFDGSQDNAKGQGEGIIEKYIKPFIGKVDMIITISQSGPNQYHIDVFGTSRRGGGDENMNFIREFESQSITPTMEWIKTTLNTNFIKAKGVIFEWTYNYSVDGKVNPPKPKDKINYGSGGDYLSNEIFFRVGKIRTELLPTLQTGHFHISKIQLIGEDLNTTKINEVLQIVKSAIKEGIKGI